MASPPAIFLEIDGAMRAGDMDRATALARAALEQGLSHPVLFSLRGYWHEAQGLTDAAIDDLGQARALAPADARVLASLGRCLTKAGRTPEALAVLDEAARRQPGLASAHYEYGVALEQSGALREARKAYERALKLAPEQPNAAARLAGLAARRSDWDEAARLAQAALALDPQEAGAHFALVMKDMAAGDPAGAEARARQVAENPAINPDVRAHALTYLADALDAQDRIAEAFAAYSQSSDLMRQTFAPRFLGVETGLPVANRVRTALAAWPKPAAEAQKPAPVFLCGFARAGTSLLGQILAGHSGVVDLEERPLLAEALDRFYFQPRGIAELETLSGAQLDAYRALYWRHVREQLGQEPGGRLVIDQTPLHTLHLPLIAKLFPDATVIFAIRDPRDVVLSCFRRQFTIHRYTWEFLSLESTAGFYDAVMQVGRLAREKLALHFCDIRNEDLVADFEGETRRMLAALGLDWEPALADFASASRARAVATPSATQIARGLNADGVGQWKRYAQQMAPVLPILEPWVKQFGYSP